MDAPDMYPAARRLIALLPDDVLDSLTTTQIDALADGFAWKLSRIWYDGAHTSAVKALAIMDPTAA